jgi:hypothetical protein
VRSVVMLVMHTEPPYAAGVSMRLRVPRAGVALAVADHPCICPRLAEVGRQGGSRRRRLIKGSDHVAIF